MEQISYGTGHESSFPCNQELEAIPKSREGQAPDNPAYDNSKSS